MAFRTLSTETIDQCRRRNSARRGPPRRVLHCSRVSSHPVQLALHKLRLEPRHPLVTNQQTRLTQRVLRLQIHSRKDDVGPRQWSPNSFHPTHPHRLAPAAQTQNSNLRGVDVKARQRVHESDHDRVVRPHASVYEAIVRTGARYAPATPVWLRASCNTLHRSIRATPVDRIDSRGRVVGINTAIIAAAQGIGFAVPAPTAEWVISEVLMHGRVRRAYLGIAGRTRKLDRRLVRALNFPSDHALEIVSREPQTPASQSDLRVGDIILKAESTDHQRR